MHWCKKIEVTWNDLESFQMLHLFFQRHLARTIFLTTHCKWMFIQLVGNLSNTSTTSPFSQLHNFYKPLNLEHTFTYHLGLCDWNHQTKTPSHKLPPNNFTYTQVAHKRNCHKKNPHKSHRTKTRDTRGNVTHHGFRKGLEFPLMLFGIVKL